MQNPTLPDDLTIARAANGIRLIKSSASQHGYTIAQLDNLPFSIYFLNPDGATVYINREGAKVCGFEDASHSLGLTLQAVSKPDSATKLIANCRAVIHTNSIQIFEEENQRNDNVCMQFLSIKAPWYDDKMQIIGVMGCSIVVGQHSLSASLAIVKQLGLMDNQPAQPTALQNVKINNVCLTQRELQCLKFTVKGYTAKRIAKELSLSHRTVEEYLTNIRTKTGASSKAALIEMTIDNYYET